MPLSPADLFLSPTLTEEEARDYLRTRGFQDATAADEHLQAMADELPVRHALADLAGPLLDALQGAPDPDAALVAFSRYLATRYPKTMFLRYLVDDPRALDVLIDVAGTSPFLSEILIRNPEYLHWLVSQIDRSPPDAADLAEEVDGLIDRVETPDAHIDVLKRFKRREVLRVAARDILGRETLESATRQLSDLADVVTERALRIAERKVLAGAGLSRPPGRFVVMGMGKLGGRELNYSSDIDLIFAYEPDDSEDQGVHSLFQKLGRTLFATLTEFTDEGYLYRVDLRLRPMGRRGAIAYSVQQHVQYYDTWGETFERFALIKVRPIAGDYALGRRLVELVQPFVYRKYLDHAAIEEIFRHKERAEKSHGAVDRDVKIGRGGIREIELFVQALLLTYGAENASLREPNTLAALQALAHTGFITDEVRDDLSRAYVFLRTVEHRLQIVHERQTHTLASARRELDVCARRLGFADASALEAELKAQRDRVHEIYNSVFERRQGSSDFKSRQLFRILTDDASEAEALEFLADHHLADPRGAREVIRALDQASSLAPSVSMARNVLANLLAALIDRLDRCANPDRVLIRLEQVTERTGAASAFYRTLLENEALRNLLMATLDLGDLPAARLIRYPELLDSLLFTLPDLDELRGRYGSALDDVEPAKRRDHIRRFKAIEEFKILVDWVGERLRPAQGAKRPSASGGVPSARNVRAGVPVRGWGPASIDDGSLARLQQRLSVLADVCVTRAAMWSAPSSEADAEWAIVALGKLGGGELTVHSDLDLVFVYRGDPGDARRFLELQHFVEETERCLEEPTDEGVAYHIDTRLRPEGKKGALAMPIGMFQRYLESRAEIWERLAWTRCRVLTGPEALAHDVEEAVAAFVYGSWDARIPHYMLNVRRRMERELGDTSGQQLEFKVGRGGLADIDFLLQMIQIREGATRRSFQIPGTRQLLEQFPETSLLTAAELDELRRAYAFLRGLETFARVEMDASLNAVSAQPKRLEALGRRLQLPAPAGEALLATYRDVTDRVRTIYEVATARLS